MTSKKQQSEKKSTRQTISISPALKDWISRYVVKENRENPEDKRFKSISAFYYYVLKNVMDLLENGKTLDDIKNYTEGKIYDFYEKYSFRASIPYFENAVEPNKYNISFYDQMSDFLFGIKQFYFQKIDSIDDVLKMHKRVNSYALSNKLAKQYDFYEVSRKGKYNKFILEYTGTYKNLHFENCKMVAAVYGFGGFKMTNCLYSENTLYCRYFLEDTELTYRNDIALSERLEMIKHNLSYIVNYEKLLNDKDYYLWMKLANDNDCIITFNNIKTRDYWFENVLKDIQKFGKKEESSISILNFFEKMHWISISIENKKELMFNVIISKEKYNEEINFMIQKLSEFGTVEKINDKYLLRSK